jgi:hypothetical protein
MAYNETPTKENKMITTHLAAARKYIADHKLEDRSADNEIIIVAAMYADLKDHDQFLKDHGLYEEFYNRED